jgi:glycosyltransferase involved in cell wall biosynthesis
VSNRVAFLTNIPAPYRLPFFRELARYCDLLVVFDASSEPNRKWASSENGLKFRYSFAKGLQIRYLRRRSDIGVDEERYLQIRYDILPKLYAFKPSVVVSGEMGVRTLQAAVYCGLTNTPLVIGWEGTPHTEAAVSRIRVFARKLLVSRAQRFLSDGHDSTASLMNYGALPDAIDKDMICIDTRFFASEVSNLLQQRAYIRSELGLEGIAFLFVGRFTEAKGLRKYLEALHRLYNAGVRGWSAVFVGSGPLEGALRSWQFEHPDVPVLINNFVQQHELPKFYAAADVFVLPTLDDVWGVVALEALVAGLPQLFSPYAGCTSDLLRDERIGRIVDPLKAEELAAALSDYIHNPPSRLPDELVRRFEAHYSPEQTALRAWESLSKVLR